MVDARFYPQPDSRSLSAMLSLAGASHLWTERSVDRIIWGADELVTATPPTIALASSKQYTADLQRSAAGAVIVSAALAEYVPSGVTAIVCEKPYDLFVTLLEQLYPNALRNLVAGIVGDTAEPIIEPDVTIGANVVIGTGVEIGRGTVVGPNTVIGGGVTIGRNCIIGANCTIHCAHLGNGVTIHPGARLGTEGFGWLGHGTTNRKVPQLGRVIIQDRCEIGPNTTIDRGSLGDTVIGENTKIGNDVTVGHNSRLGRNCLLAPTVGMAGSTKLGDGVIMGAGAASSGHLSIGDGSLILARAAVTKDWPAHSKLAGGVPAQDVRDFWKGQAMLRRMSKGHKGQ